MDNLTNIYDVFLATYVVTVLLEIAVVIVFNLFSGSSNSHIYDIEA